MKLKHKSLLVKLIIQENSNEVIKSNWSEGETIIVLK